MGQQINSILAAWLKYGITTTRDGEAHWSPRTLKQMTFEQATTTPQEAAQKVVEDYQKMHGVKV